MSALNSAKGFENDFTCGSPPALSVCLPKNYSKFELPNHKGKNTISFEILIERVVNIDDKDFK